MDRLPSSEVLPSPPHLLTLSASGGTAVNSIFLLCQNASSTLDFVGCSRKMEKTFPIPALNFSTPMIWDVTYVPPSLHGALLWPLE